MWSLCGIWAIGGLREIGFANHSDYLMVLSAQGRGVFNCLVGEKLERDPSDYYMDLWDSTTGIVNGFGILNNMDIVCGGFEYPNVLKQTTPDGWCIVIKKEKRKNYKKVKVDSDVLYLHHSTFNTIIEVGNTPYGFDRAYGFSDTGNSFVLASSSDLIIWRKGGKEESKSVTQKLNKFAVSLFYGT